MAKIVWANDGNADPVTHKFSATIDMEDGSGIQKFEGDDHKEMVEKLLTAQANATEKIQKLSRTNANIQAKPPVEVKPRSLSADEQFQLGEDLKDPAKATGAIQRVVEAAVGAPLARVGESIQESEDEKTLRLAEAASHEFVAEHPDYVVGPHNRKAIVAYGELHQLDPTKKESYAQAWEELKKAGLVEVKEVAASDGGQAQNGGLPDQPAVTIRERGAVGATGLRRVDSSQATQRTTTKPKYTKAEIDVMPEAVYREKFNSEPGFREFVDSMGTAAAAK